MRRMTPTNAIAIPPKTARDGTKAPSSGPRIVLRTTKQYAKMETKAPSTAWVGRSDMKLRSTRGEYWLAARDSATTVIENTTPATVTIEVAIADNRPRAPAAPEPNRRGQRFDKSISTVDCSSTRPTAAATLAQSIRQGRNQRLPWSARHQLRDRCPVPACPMATVCACCLNFTRCNLDESFE